METAIIASVTVIGYLLIGIVAAAGVYRSGYKEKGDPYAYNPYDELILIVTLFWFPIALGGLGWLVGCGLLALVKKLGTPR